MLDPIFSRSHRIPGRKDIPRTPTNQERVQAYRAIAPVEFWNARFNPHRQDEAAASRGALADGDFLYGGGGEPRADAEPRNGHRRDTAQRVLNQTHPPASTQSPLKDEQPRRAASPIPGTYTHTPGA